MKKIEGFTTGGYVRIIANGEYGNVPYRIEEIWQVIKWFCYPTVIDVQSLNRPAITTRVAVRACSNYPKECEWIGMEIPQSSVERAESYEIY